VALDMVHHLRGPGEGLLLLASTKKDALSLLADERKSWSLGSHYWTSHAIYGVQFSFYRRVNKYDRKRLKITEGNKFNRRVKDFNTIDFDKKDLNTII
jgi:hypothetical protein